MVPRIAGIDRRAIAGHPAVGRAGQRHEQRRAEDLAVRRGEDFADSSVAHLAAGQRGGIVPSPGRAVTASHGGHHRAAHPGLGDLLVKVADPLIEVGCVEAVTGECIPVGLRLDAIDDPRRLLAGRRVRAKHRFVFEVPALPALDRPQVLRAFGAWREQQKVDAASYEIVRGKPAGQAGWERRDRRRLASGMPRERRQGRRPRW